MICTIADCAGEYEQKEISHTIRYYGSLIVIDHVPAEVCSVCGDVLLSPEIVRHIEMLLNSVQPPSAAPVYEYA